jgi:hypothetical protein
MHLGPRGVGQQLEYLILPALKGHPGDLVGTGPRQRRGRVKEDDAIAVFKGKVPTGSFPRFSFPHRDLNLQFIASEDECQRWPELGVRKGGD